MANTSIYSTWNPRGRKPSRTQVRASQRSATLVPALRRPPSGYYDPSIDATVSAGARGLGDLRIDTGSAHTRGLEDYNTSYAGLSTGRDRSLADILRATQDLGTSFQRLGTQQAEGARAHGILSAGLAAKSQGLRDANQAQQQGVLDTQRTRVNEDFTAQSGLLKTGYDRTYGAGGDLNLALARGEREQPLLESDANALRVGQANQAGWLPQQAHWQFGKPPKRRKAPRGGGIGEG